MIKTTNLTLPEIFERARKFDTNEERVKYLKGYRSKNMRWFINMLYNNEAIVEKNIPVPDYKPSHYPVGMNPMTFGKAIPRFESACAKFDKNPKRTDNMLAMILESVSPDEAQLFIMILKGQRKIDGLSKAVWKRVYPDLFPLGSGIDA